MVRDRLLREHLLSPRAQRPRGMTELERSRLGKEQIELLQPQLDIAEHPYEGSLGTDDVNTFCEETEGTQFRSFLRRQRFIQMNL